MNILSELVGNNNFLVKVNFSDWKVLDKLINISPKDEIRIKINCKHSSKYYDPLTGYECCRDCNSLIK